MAEAHHAGADERRGSLRKAGHTVESFNPRRVSVRAGSTNSHRTVPPWPARLRLRRAFLLSGPNPSPPCQLPAALADTRTRRFGSERGPTVAQQWPTLSSLQWPRYGFNLETEEWNYWVAEGLEMKKTNGSSGAWSIKQSLASTKGMLQSYSLRLNRPAERHAGVYWLVARRSLCMSFRSFVSLGVLAFAVTSIVPMQLLRRLREVPRKRRRKRNRNPGLLL